MAFFRRGLDSLRKAEATTDLAPTYEKRWRMDMEETSAKFVILSEHIEEIDWFYEHYLSLYGTGTWHKKAAEVRVACLNYRSEDVTGTSCRPCNRQLTDDRIKRGIAYPVCIADLRPFTTDKGETWSHTKKFLVLGKKYTLMLADEVYRISPSGRCRGIVFEARRYEKRSPKHGDKFTALYMTENFEQFLENSPRAVWQQERAKEQGRVLSRKEAAREYFRVPSVEEAFGVTDTRVDYFLAFLDSLGGNQQERRAQTQGSSWGIPEPPVSSSYQPQATSSWGDPQPPRQASQPQPQPQTEWPEPEEPTEPDRPQSVQTEPDRQQPAQTESAPASPRPMPPPVGKINSPISQAVQDYGLHTTVDGKKRSSVPKKRVEQKELDQK